jgi:hypothetical protein
MSASVKLKLSALKLTIEVDQFNGRSLQWPPASDDADRPKAAHLPAGSVGHRSHRSPMSGL